MFPLQFEAWMKRLVFCPDKLDTDGWLRDYDYVIRKLSYRSQGRRVVIKSPGDTGRIPALLRQYPGARLVYIHRDPIRVFQSNLYLWSVIQNEHAFQRMADNDLDSLIIGTYRQLLSSYLRCREQIAPSHLVEIQYETLRDDPVRELSKVYDALDLGDLSEERLRRFLEAQPPYRAGTYPTSPELEARLRREWAFAFTAFQNTG
jgi:hypothetical protein